MKDKIIEFTYDPATAYYVASFVNDGQLFESKALTVAEYEGLSEAYDFQRTPFSVTASHLSSDIESIYFDTENGEETNFEIILQEFLEA